MLDASFLCCKPSFLLTLFDNVNFAVLCKYVWLYYNAIFHEGCKAECIHARYCARPHVLNAAVDHVQGDDYPVYSDYVAFYYNDVGQRVMCEETEGMLRSFQPLEHILSRLLHPGRVPSLNLLIFGFDGARSI